MLTGSRFVISRRAAAAIVRSTVVFGGLAALAGCGGGGTASGSAHLAERPTGPYRSLTVDIKITPAKAGSTDHPQGVELGLGLRLGSPKGVEPPQVKNLELEFPAGTSYGGGRVPSCDRARLEARGPGGCPIASITGHGKLLAYADTAPSAGRITVVNGGKDSLYFWMELDRPARVDGAAIGNITPRGGGYRLALSIPAKLQVVAGIPIALRELRVDAGRGTWLATTGCPGGHWSFRGTARFSDGSSVARNTDVSC
jgi:hypothetical protein